MPTIAYAPLKFTPMTRRKIDQANAIIAEYTAKGFDLTLRQLYYQFVARDLIANTPKEYKRLGDIVNNGRLGGLIDWDAITDRTRNLRSLGHWDSPADITKHVQELLDEEAWEKMEEKQAEGVRLLKTVSKDWKKLTAGL